MKKFKNICISLLACTVIVTGSGLCAAAAGVEAPSTPIMIVRATNRFSMEIPGGTLFVADKSFSMEAGEEVTVNASYSPRSASLDFGLIAPDGLFYSVNRTDGSVNYTFEIDERGSYTLAVRNNSSNSVSVVGFVNY